jgi:hypothetical protein
MHNKQLPIVGLLALLVLAGCVALPAAPARVLPTPSLAGSPLAQPSSLSYAQSFVPLVIGGSRRVGLSQDLAFRNCANLQRLGATWHYDWSPYPLDCAGSEAVPMLYAPGDGTAKPLANSAYLLIFNECDLKEQCNTDPETAARWWRQYEQTYPDRKLVGPNASHFGMAWLLAWHTAYIRLYGEPPRIWALGVHCYGVPAFCEAWVEANVPLARAWTTSGKLWLTEWAMSACYYGPGLTVAKATQALTDADEFMLWLQGQAVVERHAWFITRLDGQYCKTALLDAASQLTPYGTWFMGFTQ